MSSVRDRRIGNRGHSFGTAVIYTASSDFWVHYQGDYEIELGTKSRPKEVRAYRERVRNGPEKCALRDESLKKEIAVVFGPDISAGRAIELLRRLANQIGQRGLYTGETRSGQAMFERKVDQI